MQLMNVDAECLFAIRRQHWAGGAAGDRKSTRLNSSHANSSYVVFCVKKEIKCHRIYAPELEARETPDCAQVYADQLILDRTSHETFEPAEPPIFLERRETLPTPLQPV